MFVERRVKSAAATRNMSLSLAEELQAALSTDSQSNSHHHHHHQQQQQLLPSGLMGLGGCEVIRCGCGGGGGIAQFLVDVAELGSPDQVDPVNKFHDVVCDLAYGCVVTPRDLARHEDACTKSCCNDEHLLLAPPPTTTSGGDHVTDDVIDDVSSDTSTLLSRGDGGSDVTVTSSCAASVSEASDPGYVPSDDSAGVVTSRDEAEGKKLLLNHFDRTTSLESSRKCHQLFIIAAFSLAFHFLFEHFAVLLR